MKYPFKENLMASYSLSLILYGEILCEKFMMMAQSTPIYLLIKLSFSKRGFDLTINVWDL